MPIIQLPNGQQARFPDGTPDHIIDQAVHRDYGHLFDKKNDLKSNIDNQESYNQISGYLKEPAISVGNIGGELFKKLLNAAMLPTKLNPNSSLKGIDFDKLDLDTRKMFGGVPEEKRTFGHRLAGAAPEIAASLAAPVAGAAKGAIGLGAKYGIPLLKNMLTQGVIGAAFNPETSGESGSKAAAYTAPFSVLQQAVAEKNPMVRILARLGLGGAGAATGAALASQLPGAGLTSEGIGAFIGAVLGGKGNLRDNARKVEKAMLKHPEYKETLAAGERLGLDYLTPAEVLKTPHLATQQGEVARTKEGQDILYNKGEKRIESENKAIKKFFDTTYNPNISDSEIEKLYTAANKTKVPPEFIQKMSDNDIFKKAEKIVNSDPAYTEVLKYVPKDSIQYYNEIKRAMSGIEGKKARAGDFTAANNVASVRKKMVKDLDTFSEEYRVARRLSEDKKTRQKIENSLNEADIKGTNFFNKIKSDKVRKEMEFHLRDNPLALQMLKDLHMVGKDMINPPTIRTAHGTAKSGMDEARNSIKHASSEMVEAFINYIKNGNNSTKMANLMTNKGWDRELQKILKLSKTEKALSKVPAAVGKAGAHYQSRSEN